MLQGSGGDHGCPGDHFSPLPDHSSRKVSKLPPRCAKLNRSTLRLLQLRCTYRLHYNRPDAPGHHCRRPPLHSMLFLLLLQHPPGAWEGPPWILGSWILGFPGAWEGPPWILGSWILGFPGAWEGPPWILGSWILAREAPLHELPRRLGRHDCASGGRRRLGVRS